MYEQMADIRSKVQWAEKRITDFEVALGAFKATEPYRLRIDVDSQPGEPLVEILKAQGRLLFGAGLLTPGSEVDGAPGIIEGSI